MKKRVKVIVALDLLFLLLLITAGTVNNKIISEILRYGAFIIPILLGLVYIYLNKCDFDFPLSILPKKKTCPKALLIFAPAIAVILLLALGGSAIKEALLGAAEASLDEGFVKALILHALIPSVLEEMLFRYVPIRLLGKNYRALFLSALMFAFAHTDAFALPYTFAAGVLLGAIVMITESPLLAVALHLLNNSASLTITYYPDAAPTVLIIIGVAALISAALFFAFRKKFIPLIKDIERTEEASYLPALAFIGASLFIIITELFI